jgi:hypothetical protein
MSYSTKRINCPLGKRKDLRDSAKEIILKADSGSETNDKDYVFILNYLPKGLGLLL